MDVDFTQVLSGHMPGTHQQTFLGETHPVQRHSAGFCKSVNSVLGEGTKEMWSLARHTRHTGIPAKHSLNYPLSPPRPTLGFPFPVWWQLRAGHTGNAVGFGLRG